nr:MAG TPA: hypothetical protein [Caudoviricetes sp.]
MKVLVACEESQEVCKAGAGSYAVTQRNFRG